LQAVAFHAVAQGVATDAQQPGRLRHVATALSKRLLQMLTFQGIK
jgi:hypothetical protein